jgi:hypothetical protein
MIWRSLRTSSTRNSCRSWQRGWILWKTPISMQPSVMRLASICSEMLNACFIPLKMSTLESFHVKPCTRECPSLLTTVEGRGNPSEKGVDFCAKPKKIGWTTCGGSFLVGKANSQMAENRLSTNLALRNSVKTSLRAFWRSLPRKNQIDD